MSMNSEQMGALMSAMAKVDFNKFKELKKIDRMDIRWTQSDDFDDDFSIVKVNISTEPLNEKFGEIFLEVLKIVAGDTVTITKQ